MLKCWSSTLPTVTRQSDQWMDLNSPPLTDPSQFEIHQFATAGRASMSATPSAARGASPEGFLLIWPAMGLDARFSAAWFHPVPTLDNCRDNASREVRYPPRISMNADISAQLGDAAHRQVTG